MTTTISIMPVEKATAKVTVGPFTDESDNTVIPLTFTWTLTDKRGNVINERSAVSVTPASTISFLLKGDDLAVGSNGTQRVLLLEWTYNSTLGTNLPGKEQVLFRISDLVKVT